VETDLTFGMWLRNRRRQLDMTQTALAARIGYSVVTIRKLERDELRPSRQLAERLAQSLDVALEQQANIIAFARSADSMAMDALPQRSAQSHLPAQFTPFFGRTAELLEIGQMLADPACHLLTLVGPGGIGKTRLALEVAQTQLSQSADGVYFVSLAPLRSSAHIVPAIAEALSFPLQVEKRSPKEQLLDYLRHKKMMLVLDNFEHLLDGVELIQELLQGCPTLRLLVTSRERLRLSSELVYHLQGMDFPKGTTMQEVLTYSAVQLFVTTARRTYPKFSLDSANAQEIVHICRLVGGMPLAIILAAAWVEVLSPAEIGIELSQGFGFLEAELYDLPDRHQSMNAVLAQSWQRLSEVERVALMRLSVFRGGFTRQAAQSVAGATLQTLSALVN
jgi:predicted ATPase/transcriptional regulator with XRE-family HTH domain